MQSGTTASTSPARSALEVRRYLEESPSARARWTAELGVDSGSDRVLSELMLQHAVRTNDRGPLLVSSTRAENVVANAAAVADNPSRDSIGSFAALIASEWPVIAR
jgi:hypothetical protein